MKQKLHPSVRKCALFTLLVSLAISSFSQYSESSSYFEAGITVGPSNFLGDLGGNRGRGTMFLKDNNIPLTKLMFGGFVAYQANDWLAFRLAGNYGRLEGDDAIIKEKGGLEESRKIRNSDFRTKIIEGILVAEIYPTVFVEYDASDVVGKLRPYGLIGAGIFHFNPQGTDRLTGQWVYLKPLHTEGQGFIEYPDRKEYKLTQVNIPMGAGIKYFFSENLNISLEVIHRITRTDHMDDVSTDYIDPALFYNYLSAANADLAARMANKTGDPLGTNIQFYPGDQRGDPKENDSYYSIGFKLGFRLGGNSDRRWNNSTRCPIRF